MFMKNKLHIDIDPWKEHNYCIHSDYYHYHVNFGLWCDFVNLKYNLCRLVIVSEHISHFIYIFWPVNVNDSRNSWAFEALVMDLGQFSHGSFSFVVVLNKKFQPSDAIL